MSGLVTFALIVEPSFCISMLRVIIAAVNALALPSIPGISSLTDVLDLFSVIVASSAILSPVTLSLVTLSLGASNFTLRSPLPSGLPVAATASLDTTSSLVAGFASTSPLADATRLVMPAAVPFALKSNPSST